MTDVPSIGGMRLHDAVVPDLAAGLYRIHSGLKVAEGATPLAAPADQEAFVEVVAPRFGLASSDVADSFPPSGAKGAFAAYLPHVALGRRTLPWERKIGHADAAGSAPWLALLVVRADEAEVASGTVRTSLPPAVVSELDARDPLVGDPPVSLLKLKQLDTFRAILPSRHEAALLAHVRQVNLADTVMAGNDDDGWFALLTANRLPIGQAGAETGYIACLVSLEARDDIWAVPNGQAPPPLVLLHSWPFTTADEGGTFAEVAAKLDAAPFGGAAGDEALLDALGRLSVDHTDHDGMTATSLYRGPLVGVSDDALPAGGGDISLAAAGEIGRLLGIADGRFLRELVEWHRKAEAAIRAGIEADEMKTMVDVAGAIGSVAQLQDMLLAKIDRSRVPIANIGRLTIPRIVP